MLRGGRLARGQDVSLARAAAAPRLFVIASSCALDPKVLLWRGRSGLPRPRRFTTCAVLSFVIIEFTFYNSVASLWESSAVSLFLVSLSLYLSVYLSLSLSSPLFFSSPSFPLLSSLSISLFSSPLFFSSPSFPLLLSICLSLSLSLLPLFSFSHLI